MSVIEFLDESFLLDILPSPINTGINPIFKASIDSDDGPIHCYVKPQPNYCYSKPHISNKELTSECIGYFLAKKSGLSVPRYAGIINIPLSIMPKKTQEQLIKITPTNPQEHYLCWFSQDMIYPNLATEFPYQSGKKCAFKEIRFKRILSDLHDHADTPKIISFDEWLQNSDRNLGNLLYSKGKQPILIDHGRLFCFPDWEPDKLNRPVKPPNILLEVLSNFIQNYDQHFPSISRRKLAYNGFSSTIKDSMNLKELNDLLGALSYTQEAITQITDFLKARTNSTAVNSNLGMLI